MQPGVGYLRSYSRAKVVEDALRAARIRLGMRLIHYSIQGNHLHLIVEAEDASALARGMQGLAIRIARRLNALAGRSGTVFADRYHSRPLRTRREDALSSARFLRASASEDAPVAAPRAWLLRVGWHSDPSAVAILPHPP